MMSSPDWTRPVYAMVDVGGASGTWTLALLRAMPDATAVIFDLPDAIKLAEKRIAESGLADRIELAPGDFYRDELPGDCDFAWVSAIIHQHGRERNKEFLAKVYRALRPGGTIGLRDVVMRPDRTAPTPGAMFAVNMLACTDTGMTYTMAEVAEDLEAAGFIEPKLAIQDEFMNSVVTARRADS